MARAPRLRRGLLRELGLPLAVAALAALVVRTAVVQVFRIPSASMVPALLVGDHVLVWTGAYALRLPLADRVLLELAAPARGDVVVFAHPREPGRVLVKRVVGLPGDVVELRDGAVVVNGVVQPQEPRGELRYQDRRPADGSWWSEACALHEEALARGPVAPPRGAPPGEEAAAGAAAWATATGPGTPGVLRHGVLRCRRGRGGEDEGPWARVEPGHLFVLGDNRDRSQDSRGALGWQVPAAAVKGRAWRVLGRLAPREGGGLRLERLFKPVE